MVSGTGGGADDALVIAANLGGFGGGGGTLGIVWCRVTKVNELSAAWLPSENSQHGITKWPEGANSH